MLFLYNLPGWLMAVCIVGTVVGLAYPGYFLIRQVWRRSFTDVETNVSMAVLTVIATIYALLLAFVAVSVWQSFGAAETAVVNEANSVGQLARDLSIFDSAESLEARRMLRKYADIVATVEWHDMERGQSNSEAWNAFDRMFHTIGELEPDTPRREALTPEIWATANDVLNERRTRLHTAEAALTAHAMGGRIDRLRAHDGDDCGACADTLPPLDHRAARDVDRTRLLPHRRDGPSVRG